MPSPRQPIFDSSLAALVLVNDAYGLRRVPTTRLRSPSPGLDERNATAISIQFAPESDPTATVLELAEGQTTGPLPLGFEFEFFGERYDWFDLSSDGFLTFTRPPLAHSYSASRFRPSGGVSKSFITLGWTDVGPLGRRNVAYEVRGAPARRRLVLSFSRVPASTDAGLGKMIAQLVLYERTGMIDLHTTRHDPAAGRVKQEAARFTTAS